MHFYNTNGHKKIAGYGGSGLVKPDLLSECFQAIVAICHECDEDQHKTYLLGDEERRMRTIADHFRNKKMIFIRTNPDAFIRDGETKRLPKKQRHQMHVDLVLHLLKHPPIEDVKVYYICYNYDNPNITKQFPFEHCN